MKRGTTLAKAKNTRKIRLLGFALLIVGLSGSSAFALDPMGPPAAELKLGQVRGGLDYSYSTMDFKLIEGEYIKTRDGEFFESGEMLHLTLKDFKAHKAYASLGYGFMENWEAFLRIGATKATFGDSIWNDDEEFDGSTDFAIGGGVKATLYEEYNMIIGGLFQANWAKYDGKLESSLWSAPDFVGIELTEMQVALGVTYLMTERVSFYGGPFAHFVYGKFDDTFSALSASRMLTSEYSWNIDEGPIYGGYFGARIKLFDECFFNVEYQQSAKAQAFGARIMFRY